MNDQRRPLVGDPAEDDTGKTMRVHDGSTSGTIGHGHFLAESGGTCNWRVTFQQVGMGPDGWGNWSILSGHTFRLENHIYVITLHPRPIPQVARNEPFPVSYTHLTLPTS